MNCRLVFNCYGPTFSHGTVAHFNPEPRFIALIEVFYAAKYHLYPYVLKLIKTNEACYDILVPIGYITILNANEIRFDYDP